MGWVALRRDFGELTFMTLRDSRWRNAVVLNSEDAPNSRGALPLRRFRASDCAGFVAQRQPRRLRR